MILNETNETAAASWPNSSVHRWSDRWSVDFFANTILRWRSRGTRNCCVALLLLTKAFVGWCGDGGVWWGFFDPLSYREINPGGKFLCSLSALRVARSLFFTLVPRPQYVYCPLLINTPTRYFLFLPKLLFSQINLFQLAAPNDWGGTLFRQM